MYSTCLFCQHPLGRNEVLEHFPVGRRLAYDAARGRLWVVCRKCERWNLTPLDSRWEAIEDAERLFRGTRLRASTDQVGLARLREGLELVRIGEPLRPEMAAWRYGDQFGRRWKRHVALSALGAAAVGGVVVAGPVMGLVSLGAASPILNVLNFATFFQASRRTTAKVTIPGHEGELHVTRQHLAGLLLVPDASHGFRLHVTGVRRKSSWWSGPGGGAQRAGAHDVYGTDALRVAAAILPKLNVNGASRRVVQDAVDLVEMGRSPEETFALVAHAQQRRVRSRNLQLGDGRTLGAFPMAARLALEMASHEDAERRALEGELAELERAWQHAEEIAAIADDLALPGRVRGAFERLKGAAPTDR